MEVPENIRLPKPLVMPNERKVQRPLRKSQPNRATANTNPLHRLDAIGRHLSIVLDSFAASRKTAREMPMRLRRRNQLQPTNRQKNLRFLLVAGRRPLNRLGRANHPKRQRRGRKPSKQRKPAHRVLAQSQERRASIEKETMPFCR
jgi:hypothetical protein